MSTVLISLLTHVDKPSDFSSTPQAFPKSWSEIDCIWRSNVKSGNAMHRCTRTKTEWRSSKCRRFAISTFRRASASSVEWRWLETEWNDCGVRTKVRNESNSLSALLTSLLVLSLQELCCRAIVARTTVYSIEQLPLPTSVKSHLKSYAMTTSTTQVRYNHSQRNNKGTLGHRRLRFIIPSTGISTPTSPGVEPGNCTGRNSCTIS